MPNEIVQYEGATALTQWKEPEQVLADAQKAAKALKSVLELKPNKVVFNNEQYLEREDWGTVARFYGCTAKSIETRYVEFGNVRGWEAVAVVIDANMNEIGRAESMCLSDEENWGEVPKYEWQDELDEQGKKIWDRSLRAGKGGYRGKRVLVGTTPKPLFQLRSMAQTRAEAKALKSVFGWVVVLAGYKPTPAEEMTGHEFDNQEEPKPQVQQPQRASEKQQGNPSQPQETITRSNEISGLIETARSSKSNDGTIWLATGAGLIMVPVDKVDSDMVPGSFIKCHAIQKHSEKAGDYYILTSLMELSTQENVIEGDAERVVEGNDSPLQEDAKQVAQEIFGGNDAVKSMVDKGTLKPASQIPSTKTGTIGIKRAQRLYTLMSNNKAANHGFNEEEAKKILASMYPGDHREHLRDLESQFYEQFEKWSTGEEDWREFWKED